MPLRFNSCVFLLAALLVGCADKFGEGYAAGYADGHKDATSASAATRAELEAEIAQMRIRATAVRLPAWTDVCGGGGANVNGKFVKAGKTGCVRVSEDGTFQRY